MVSTSVKPCANAGIWEFPKKTSTQRWAEIVIKFEYPCVIRVLEVHIKYTYQFSHVIVESSRRVSNLLRTPRARPSNRQSINRVNLWKSIARSCVSFNRG